MRRKKDEHQVEISDSRLRLTSPLLLILLGALGIYNLAQRPSPKVYDAPAAALHQCTIALQEKYPSRTWHLTAVQINSPFTVHNRYTSYSDGDSSVVSCIGNTNAPASLKRTVFPVTRR